MNNINDLLVPVIRIMTINDLFNYLWMFYEDDKFVPHINCSDLFYWGGADSEEITVSRLPLLKQAIEDCETLEGDTWHYDAPLLFCARIRKMRPQGAAYEYIDERLWPLFDACGPERKAQPGNPVSQDEIRT